MLFTFLGTAAANAYPEAFCRCDRCEQARSLGGASLRKRSAALVNDDLLIDLGPDIMAASQAHARPLTAVRFCLQTHAHADHFDPSHFLSRSPGYGVAGAPRLHFYASAGTLRCATRLLERDCAPGGFLDPATGDRLNLTVHPIAAQQSVVFGRYHVTAFAANHDPEIDPLLYAIRADGKCIFYGTDTAAFPEETWQGFRRHQLKFDLVVLDHTYGPGKSGGDHLSARQFIEHMARMRQEGWLADRARFFATHIAHDGNPPHPEMAEFAQRHGYEVAYDGLVLEI
jgi:phosphoribosyl 1,2-cyclic phosphodiesterase